MVVFHRRGSRVRRKGDEKGRKSAWQRWQLLRWLGPHYGLRGRGNHDDSDFEVGHHLVTASPAAKKPWHAHVLNPVHVPRASTALRQHRQRRKPGDHGWNWTTRGMLYGLINHLVAPCREPTVALCFLPISSLLLGRIERFRARTGYLDPFT